MTFKELIKQKNITSYQLAKATDIPYTTINDLLNGKTCMGNIRLKHALAIASVLDVDINLLIGLDTIEVEEFRYFRNNTLMELKRKGYQEFITWVISTRMIDYYYKNNKREYAYYLLALIDYLSKQNNLPIYISRYNNIRKEKLDKPFFVGSDLYSFDTFEAATNELHITPIDEFKKYNLIEGDITNVA